MRTEAWNSDVRRVLLALMTALLCLGVASPVSAHAELVSSQPAAGATVSQPLTAVDATFNEVLDASRSTMQLRDSAGQIVAQGGVVIGVTDPLAMHIDVTAALPDGVYEVRWTSVTSDDQGVERGTFQFTLGGSPGATSSPRATPGATSSPGATPGATSSPGATPDATEAPIVPVPGPSGLEPGALLVVAMIAMIAVVVLLVAWRLRRRERVG